jgi:methylmalonyl-CoA/ethylmalonyl-CoA epimerase
VPPTRIHHLNFVVRDMDEATARFESVLGVAPFEIVDYAARGAHVARTRVGETWLVLVCPYDDESIPGRYLAERGEGFFLASFGVDDLQAHLDRLGHEGIDTTDPAARDGILDWQVADIGEFHGARLQLTRDKQ